ncbi:MAG: type II and III secretion system protein family protein [Paracoccaceae bacterium]
MADRIRTCWPILTAVVVLLAFHAGPAAAQRVITLTQGAGDRRVVVGVDQAVVLRADRAFADVSVAQPEIADIEVLSETSLYVFGRGRGRTSLTLIDASGGLIANVTVVVDQRATELEQRLAELLPGEDVRVDTLGGGVVLSGQLSGAREVDQAMALARAYAGEEVTNLMSVGGGQQVSLRVRIAEVSRSAAKQLGIGLGAADGRSSAASGGVNVLPGGVPSNVFRGGPQGGFGALDAVVSVSQGLQLNVAIDALESNGLARLLAEPTLVALSGGEAEFLAGGEVPVPSIDADGDVTIVYRPVGISLSFRPTVVTGDRINVAVASEVSSIDDALGTSVGSQRLAGFSVRRATTQVELRDGQSIAIAGLYQDGFSDGIDQVPVLGDIPVLGALFRSARFQRDETELVILITAHLVGPVDDVRALPDPLARAPIPTEGELFLFGTLSGRGAATPAFDGPFGYAYD